MEWYKDKLNVRLFYMPLTMTPGNNIEFLVFLKNIHKINVNCYIPWEQIKLLISLFSHLILVLLTIIEACASVTFRM